MDLHQPRDTGKDLPEGFRLLNFVRARILDLLRQERIKR
jgi:hypothetical protein